MLCTYPAGDALTESGAARNFQNADFSEVRKEPEAAIWSLLRTGAGAEARDGGPVIVSPGSSGRRFAGAERGANPRP